MPVIRRRCFRLVRAALPVLALLLTGVAHAAVGRRRGSAAMRRSWACRSKAGRSTCQVFGDGEDVLWILATIHGNEAAGTPLVGEVRRVARDASRGARGPPRGDHAGGEPRRLRRQHAAQQERRRSQPQLSRRQLRRRREDLRRHAALGAGEPRADADAHAVLPRPRREHSPAVRRAWTTTAPSRRAGQGDGRQVQAAGESASAAGRARWARSWGSRWASRSSRSSCPKTPAWTATTLWKEYGEALIAALRYAESEQSSLTQRRRDAEDG